ncbi:MGMT family protein [Corallococcus sicarius]|uniref:MGMT family protein n=1 Tax=Corallococcus sicarius TaxID=2316726 RepID=A0A3A8NNI8_9BACT|nr:MGMT family protein [Corallococcus sicarius]RKH45956.1 MGMT family protein [Corallococcus sicarius]
MPPKKPAAAPLPFHESVMHQVRSIPRGEVRSYAQVALYAGRPGGARGVGRELKLLPGTRTQVPWWRVIRSDGTLAPLVAHEQARRLRLEGVTVAERGQVFRVALKDREDG